MVPPFDAGTTGRPAAELSSLSHEELLEALHETMRARRALEAQFLLLTREVENRTPQVVSGDAYGSVKKLLASELRLDEYEAGRAVSLSRRLGIFDATDAALVAGEIDADHARAIHHTLRPTDGAIVSPEFRRAVEDAMLGASKDCSPSDIRALGAQIRDALWPHSLGDDEERAYDARRAYLNTVGDRTVFHLEGDLTAAAIIDAVLGPLMGKTDPNDTRTLQQRRHDAVIDAFSRLLDSDTLPDHGNGRPHVTVVADVRSVFTPESRFARDLRPGQSHPDAEPSASPLWPAPLLSTPAGWRPISHRLLFEICCDSKLAAAAFSADTHILDLHRDVRTVTPAQMRALTLRDGGCRVRGCHRPPEHCIAHHIVWWSEQGETDLNNLVLLCRYHHRLIHRRGWRIEGTPDDALQFIGPYGARLDDANPRSRP
jgi:hypothetical protein